MSDSPEPSRSARIAVIGDLHDFWTDHDVEQLNRTDYDLVLFVGDLGRGAAQSKRLALSIARIDHPTLVMPGNADAPHGAQLAAEFSLRRGLDRLLADECETRGVRLCGYSLHRPRLPGVDLSIVCGRPYSMGGPELAFTPQLANSFGITSMEDSSKRIADLVDRAETRDLLFLSHNGPLGLGDDPTDPWGCDFLPERADWGDPDLAFAIDHARRQGRRVVAVVAGHMHLGLKGLDAERNWLRRDAETLYVNPARVPRILSREGAQHHHHVELTLSSDGASAEEVFVRASPA